MKRMLSLYLAVLFFGAGHKTYARVFNSTIDPESGERVVDSGAGDNQVFSTASFGSLLCDFGTQSAFAADSSSTPGNHSIMRADFSDGGKCVLSALGGALLGGSTSTPLLNQPVNKILWLDSGNILVLLKNSTEQFYVLSSPMTSAPVVVASPAMVDLGSSAANIVSIASAGQYDGKDRIVVAVLKSGATDLLTSGTASVATFYTYLYDSSAQTIEQAGQSRLVNSSTAMGLDATSGLGHTLISSGASNISNITCMAWGDEVSRLYVGTTGNRALTTNFIAVGSFASDLYSTLPDGVADNDLVFSKFAPVSSSTAANVCSMAVTATTTSWSVNYLKCMVSPGNKEPYLVAQIDYQGFTGGLFALPIVAASENASASDVGLFAQLGVDGVHVKATAFSATDFGFLPLQTPTSACNDVKALVGGYNLVTTGASDLAVHLSGGSVYQAARISATSNRPDAGVFASNPIYAGNGAIAGWTSWKKAFADSYYNVSGTPSGSAIYDFGVFDGQVYYTAKNYDQTSATINEVGRLSWGSGDIYNVSGVQKFLNRMNSDFAGSGIWTVADFPAVTTVGLGNVGLNIVATRNKVAIASTGGLLTRWITASVDCRSKNPMDRPYLTAAFGDTDLTTNFDQHYLLFDDVDDIGDILCAEVARVTNARPESATTVNPGAVSAYPRTHGFIFVGGQNGIAVLRNSDGTGFDASCGSKTWAGGTPTNSEAMSNALQNLSTSLGGMTFKRIPGITEPIHAMVSAYGFLYAMSATNVYRIRLHSILEEFFPDYTAAASMFQDDMVCSPVVEATEMLDDLAASYASDLVTTNGTSGLTTFNNNVVVIQKVLSAGPNEYFADMVCMPNSGPVFIASNVAGNSNIYTLKYPSAASCDPAGEPVRQSSTPMSVFYDTSYVKSYPYMVRRLAISSINMYNRELETYVAGTTPTRQYIGDAASEFSSRGLYGVGNSGVIGNLYVLGGSIYTAPVLHVHAILGNVAGLVQSSTEKQLLSPAAFAAGDSTWLSDPIANLTQSLSVLPSGLDLVGAPYIYAHSSKGVNNNLNVLDFGNSDALLTPVDANIPSDSYVFGSMHFENGGQGLFGCSFGGRALE